jgi:hypothetical protein
MIAAAIGSNRPVAAIRGSSSSGWMILRGVQFLSAARSQQPELKIGTARQLSRDIIARSGAIGLCDAPDETDLTEGVLLELDQPGTWTAVITPAAAPRIPFPPTGFPRQRHPKMRCRYKGSTLPSSAPPRRRADKQRHAACMIFAIPSQDRTNIASDENQFHQRASSRVFG